MSIGNGTEDAGFGASNFGIVPRPPFQLRSLPVRFRWEVTRRHPYYQTFWTAARNFHRQARQEVEVEPLVREASVIVLAAIGVSGDPPDPSTEFDELIDQQMEAGWLAGTVHPLTLRGLASILIAYLPPRTLSVLAAVFFNASRADDEHARIRAMLDLGELDHAELDQFPDEPYVSINPGASNRTVNEAINQLMPHWRTQRQLDNRRDRSDRYTEYLRVWDLREGWNGARYDRASEQRLRDVASSLGRSVGTVSNQYRSAFQLITGHDYSPDLWFRLFGPEKLSELFGSVPGEISRRRPQTSPVRRDVPETTLSGPSDSPGIVSSSGTTTGETNVRLLVRDIVALIDGGLADERIADELELDRTTIPAIANVRARGTDGLI